MTEKEKINFDFNPDELFNESEPQNDFLETFDDLNELEETTIEAPVELKIDEIPQETVADLIEDSVPGTTVDEDSTVKRSSKDFNPDMDALIITAQSPMIIEALKYYSKSNFKTHTIPIYKEAVTGVNIFIKILERSPENYQKLQKVIMLDKDCKEVERTAYELFKKKNYHTPETDHEKILAFDALNNLFNNALKKAHISESAEKIKEFFLLGGDFNREFYHKKYYSSMQEMDTLSRDLIEDIETAKHLLRTDTSRINRILQHRNINLFIINATYILTYYFFLKKDKNTSDYYYRMNSNYKKYFVVK